MPNLVKVRIRGNTSAKEVPFEEYKLHHNKYWGSTNTGEYLLYSIPAVTVSTQKLYSRRSCLLRVQTKPQHNNSNTS